MAVSDTELMCISRPLSKLVIRTQSALCLTLWWECPRSYAGDKFVLYAQGRELNSSDVQSSDLLVCSLLCSENSSHFPLLKAITASNLSLQHHWNRPRRQFTETANSWGYTSVIEGKICPDIPECLFRRKI